MHETEWVLQSERLMFRKIKNEDVQDLRAILQDLEVMYAWEHAFTDQEVDEWIEENIRRYASDGFSYFAAIEKKSRRLVGVVGPLVETFDGNSSVGVGYILKKTEWQKGYAVEGAKACMEYAFVAMSAERVVAMIRPENAASRRVAEKIGMRIEGEFVRHYHGKELIHLIYSKQRDGGE